MDYKGKWQYPVVSTFSEHTPAPFVDKVSDNEVYYGWAPLGVGETDEGWRIMKEVTVGSVTKRLYANGSMDFGFSWEKRREYSYKR